MKLIFFYSFCLLTDVPAPMGKGDILLFGVGPVGIGIHFGINDTFLSAQYFVNQWLESYQIFLDI